MSSQETAHIRYEPIDRPRAAVVEFLTRAFGDPERASELSRQLASLVRPELPDRYIVDFRDVHTFSSTGFGALVAFVLKVRKAGGQVVICNMDEFVRFGADIIHLGDYAPIVADRRAALDRLAAEDASSGAAIGS